MPYAFLSHESACEVLREKGASGRRWPTEGRLLPIWGDCVAGQRQMKTLEQSVDFETLGVVTRPIDVIVPTSGYRTRGKYIRTHVWSSAIPAGSMMWVHPNVLVSGPEFTLLQMAHAHNMHWPQYEVVAKKIVEENEMLRRYGYEGKAKGEKPLLWEPVRSLVMLVRQAVEFLGTYRFGKSGEEAKSDQPQLMTLESGRDFAKGVHKRRASTQLLRALDLALENSASPRETDLSLMLTLPVELGGYGLTRPVLNKRIDAPVGWYVLTGERHIKPDLLWEDCQVIVEYYGHKAHRALGQSKTDRDIMRANMLRAMGYRVLEVTHGVVSTAARMDFFVNQAATLLGQRVPEANEDARTVRRHLYEELFSVEWEAS